MHVSFDGTRPLDTGKGSSSFDVSGVITENFIKDDDPKVDPYISLGIK